MTYSKKVPVLLAASLALMVGSFANEAFAMPENSRFKNAFRRDITLKGCLGVVDGMTTRALVFAKRGKRVGPPAKFNKKTLALGSPTLKFFACGPDDENEGRMTLWGKTTKNAEEATKFTFEADDFQSLPENSLSRSCNRVQPWASTLIYKTVGSTHFSLSDPRRYTIALIIESGSQLPRASCIDFVGRNGKVVGKMGLYATGGGWHARYYGGTGCGTRLGGAAFARKVINETGSDDIYAKFGTTCYGPIDANRCIGSSQC
jgi:hypothetical protein